jgi:predicted Zn-dependent protease
MKSYLLIILSVLTLGQGCATSAATMAAANVLVPVSEENSLGLKMQPEIETEAKLSSNAALQSYVQSLGAKVAKAAQRDIPSGIKLQFKVVDDPNTVNAFAIPGGTIYVYTGLLKAASSEAEVVGVLGHETAHVTRRHVAQQMVTMYGLQGVLDMGLGKNPGMISSTVANVASQGYLLKYSRDHERDADEFGIKYAAAAGYDPHGFANFFKKLGGSGGPEFLSTHPEPTARASTAESRIKAMSNPPTYTGEAEFKAKKAEFGL